MRSPTKSRLGGRARILALSVLAVLLVPVAIAWACNPQAYMKSSGGSQGSSVAPGGTLGVSGAYFQTNTALTLSLDSGGTVGNVTTNSGGSFSTSFQVPSQPGSYTLLAKRSDGAARSGLPARLSFEVAAPSSAAPSPTTEPPAATPQAQGPAFNDPSVNRSPAQQQRPSSGGREQGTSTPGDSPAARTPASGGSDGTAITEDAGREVFAGSVAPSGSSSTTFGSPASPSSGSQAEPSTGASGRSSGSPSEQTAGGDVWSGFGSGSSASLMPSATDATPDGGPGSGLGWGIGLLSLGLVALVSGVAVAEVRRRRALAGS